MTPEKIHTIIQRKYAAQSVLKFFTDVVQVESTNLKSSRVYKSVTARRIVSAYRKRDKENGHFSIMQAFADAARTGLGKCFEKSAIAYAALYGNPRINGNSAVLLCSVVNKDHAFVIITEKYAMDQTRFYLQNLSKATMVLDGLTEDWYFPNLSRFEALRYNVGNGTTNVEQRTYRRTICDNVVKPHHIAMFPVRLLCF